MNGIQEQNPSVSGSLGDDTPIIILTAYDWSDIEAEARAAGVTAFCAKPLFMSDIRETLMTAHRPESSLNSEDIWFFRGSRIQISEADVYCLWKIMN